MRGTKKTHLRGALLVAAFALAAVGLSAGSVWAVYSNDGAIQNASGGWDIPSGVCSEDPLGGPAINKYDCQSIIFSHGGWCSVTTATACNVDGDCPPSETCEGEALDVLYDTQALCEAAGKEWRSTACDNPEYRYQSNSSSSCEGNGHVWLSNVCRGLYDWSNWPMTFPSSNSDANYRNNCIRCHNSQYYPVGWHGEERGVGDTYVMTGHKNMARPVMPSGETNPYYTAGFPWAGADGTVYGPNPTPFDWVNGKYNAAQMFWIYNGWIASTPSAIYSRDPKTDGTPNASYSCGRCHTTGWSSDPTLQATKQPEAMFPGISWDGTTPAPTGVVNLKSGITGDTNQYSSWDQWGIQCSRCHGSQIATGSPDPRHHPNIPGKEATGSSSSGATRTALCMDCHRQESGGLPMDATHPGTVLKIGDSHGELGILSHSHGNQYLNSPHGLFTGTFAQINLKALYGTDFENDGVNFEGGCTGCHNVHKSTVKAANPDGGAVKECTECHSVDLARIQHPNGAGTPLENMATDPSEACVTCHMPDGMHLFRINSSASYFTMPPMPANEGDCLAASGTWNSSTSICNAWNAGTEADGAFTSAVWVDVDHACGQCHGGSNGPTGTANGAFFRDKNLLAQYAQNMHQTAPVDNSSVTFGYALDSSDPLKIVVWASADCGGPCSAYNWTFGDGDTETGAGTSHTYALAGTYPVKLTVPGVGSKTKNVTVYAADLRPTVVGTVCEDIVNPDTWEGELGDDSYDNNGDGSHNPAGIKQVTVNWGDGTMLGIGPQDASFNHTYRNPGTYTITHKAIDTAGQQAVRSCAVNVKYFSIKGTVKAPRTHGNLTNQTTCENSGGVWDEGNSVCNLSATQCADVKGQVESGQCIAPLASAKVEVKKDGSGVVERIVYTATNGKFTAGSLKPGMYDLSVTSPGYEFTDPAANNVEVGGSKTVPDIVGTIPAP